MAYVRHKMHAGSVGPSGATISGGKSIIININVPPNPDDWMGWEGLPVMRIIQ